jgi:hypothetical protein
MGDFGLAPALGTDQIFRVDTIFSLNADSKPIFLVWAHLYK